MEPQQLQNLVARYKNNRAFIAAFNAATEGEYLHETTLSRQLGGSIKISGAWSAAYKLFFNNQRFAAQTVDKMKIGNYVLDTPSKDYSRANNGGEYEFGHYPVMKNGNLIGKLKDTSAGFDYCQITGTFTRTTCVDVAGTDIYLEVDRQLVGQGKSEISQKEFIQLLQRR